MVPLPFADRRAAGRLLAARVADATRGEPWREPLVLALPRGGVAVGREVADALQAPLDVLVTRKIGYPGQPEFGVGAIAEGGEPVYDLAILARLGLSQAQLEPALARERTELARRVAAYRTGPPPEVAGRAVIVTDDGLATGVTARAALRALRSRSAARIMLAVPVAATSSAAELAGEADRMVVLATPSNFRSVGEWYVSFGQLTDADVLDLLDRGHGRLTPEAEPPSGTGSAGVRGPAPG